MEIDGCDQSSCHITRHQNITVTAAFKSKYAADELKVLLRASDKRYIFNLTPTFEDGCKTSPCPVVIGQNIYISVTANVDIEPIFLEYPEMNLSLMVINEKRERLMCAETKISYSN